MSQPAIYVASLAALEKMKSTEEGAAAIEAVDVCAGLSLGEYTALTFAGAITFEDGVKLVKLRGESMQAAADATPSGMASVIGLDAEKVGEVCKARFSPLPLIRSFSPSVHSLVHSSLHPSIHSSTHSCASVRVFKAERLN